MCFWIENRYLFYLTTKDTECSRSRVINGKEKPPPILRLMMGWWHAPVVGRWFHGPYNLLYSRSSCTEGIANDDDDDGEFRDMQRFNLPFESVHKGRTDSSFLTWRKRRRGEKKRPGLNVEDEIMVISQRLGKTQPNYSLLRNVVSFLLFCILTILLILTVHQSAWWCFYQLKKLVITLSGRAKRKRGRE